MLAIKSICQDLTHLLYLAEERDEAALAGGAATATATRLGGLFCKNEELGRLSVVLTNHFQVFFGLHDLGHESEADETMGCALCDLIRFGVSLKPSLFVLINKVVVQGGRVPRPVVDWLQLNVVAEPDYSV